MDPVRHTCITLCCCDVYTVVSGSLSSGPGEERRRLGGPPVGSSHTSSPLSLSLILFFSIHISCPSLEIQEPGLGKRLLAEGRRSVTRPGGPPKHLLKSGAPWNQATVHGRAGKVQGWGAKYAATCTPEDLTPRWPPGGLEVTAVLL